LRIIFLVYSKNDIGEMAMIDEPIHCDGCGYEGWLSSCDVRQDALDNMYYYCPKCDTLLETEEALDAEKSTDT
jgi:hypothetical protein